MVSDSFAFAFSYDTSPAGICILRGLQPRPAGEIGGGGGYGFLVDRFGVRDAVSGIL